jgi:hypothetical protein
LEKFEEERLTVTRGKSELSRQPPMNFLSSTEGKGLFQIRRRICKKERFGSPDAVEHL